MKPTRVAVLGAGGQIGAHLLRHLPETPGVSAVGICRNEITAGPLRAAGFDIRCGDVASKAREVLGDCDVVLNCASAGSQPAQARREDSAVLRGLFSLRPGTTIVHFSSVAVYGTSIVPRKSTFERPNLDSGYALSKIYLERLARRLAARSGLGLTVLRMGHVYGAEQWLSRFVITQAGAKGFRLPFDGQLVSNAVHVHNVAAAMRRLVLQPEPGRTFNLFDCPQTTWRQVFDWNTSALGLAAAPGLDPAASERVKHRHHSLAKTPLLWRAVREVSTWLRSAPGLLVASSPSLKNVGHAAIARLQWQWLEQRTLKFVTRVRVAAGAPPRPGDSGYLVSAEAPGPALDYRAEVDAEDSAALLAWYRTWSDPSSLTDVWRSEPGSVKHGLQRT